MRWSRNVVLVIDNVAQNTTCYTPMAEQFNFTNEMLCINRNKFDKRNQSVHEHVGGKESFVEINGEGLLACATFSVSGMDGLSPNVRKRKYSMIK